MFKCPKCNHKLVEITCPKCNFEVKVNNGVHYFTEDPNLNLKDNGNKYIGYDEITVDFDPTLIYWGEHYGIYEACANDIVYKRGKEIVILDLGCGLGSASIPLAKAGAYTIGADISAKMLEYAYKRNGGNLSNLYLCKMNAYELMIEENSIDIVVENAMLHLVDNCEKVYQEIYRVLKPNGVLIRFNSHGLSKTEEQKELSQKCYTALKDIRNYYSDLLKTQGYESKEFNNNYLEIGKQYFKTYEDEEHQPILDYTEEFTELMKFRIHRLEHKAQSGLQHVPNDIHQKVWKQVDKYAKEKYGEDYKNIPSYSKYKACYDVYDKVIRDLKE